MTKKEAINELEWHYLRLNKTEIPFLKDIAKKVGFEFDFGDFKKGYTVLLWWLNGCDIRKYAYTDDSMQLSVRGRAMEDGLNPDALSGTWQQMNDQRIKLGRQIK